MTPDLDAVSLRAHLTGTFGDTLEYHDEIDSTNRRALELAAAGAPEGTLVVADHQTSGRGRLGRSWLSEPGGALLFSVVLRGPGLLAAPGLVTTALGVAVRDGLDASTGIEARLKWPNDVVVGERKVAGILVESAGEAAVAGVGVNISFASGPPEKIAARATSVAQAMSATPPERARLLGELMRRIESRYGELHTAAGRARVVADAARSSAILGRRVVVHVAGRPPIEGVAEGLSEDGSLLLDTPEGPATIGAGEVELLRPQDQRIT